MNDLQLAPVMLESWPLAMQMAFTAHGIKTWEDFTKHSRQSFLRRNGVGKKTLDKLERELSARGLALSSEPTYGVPLNVVSVPPSITRGIYFIQCDKYVKIGLSKDIRRRFINLNLAVPFKLDLLAIESPAGDLRQAETAIHERFADLRVKGEWFKLEEPLIGYIRELMARIAA